MHALNLSALLPVLWIAVGTLVASSLAVVYFARRGRGLGVGAVALMLLAAAVAVWSAVIVAAIGLFWLVFH